jgi:hypothetical protein
MTLFAREYSLHNAHHLGAAEVQDVRKVTQPISGTYSVFPKINYIEIRKQKTKKKNVEISTVFYIVT